MFELPMTFIQSRSNSWRYHIYCITKNATRICRRIGSSKSSGKGGCGPELFHDNFSTVDPEASFVETTPGLDYRRFACATSDMCVVAQTK
jgi:hypothetical protein